MAKDLLLQLFDLWVKNSNVPDEMSLEFGRLNDPDNDSPIIYLRWRNTGREKEFGYTPFRYENLTREFNRYWKEKSNIKSI